MNKKSLVSDFKYAYGPVSSWRLGVSLGIDLLSQRSKICGFDCTYCQLGKTQAYTTERKIFVPTQKIIKELKLFPKVKVDYITFSGRGEPTLAKNLGEVIAATKNLRREPIAVLTNSSMIYRPDVRGELALADFVVAKLDACSGDSFKSINRPARGIEFRDVLNGLKQFRKEYKKGLALQIMFVKNNKSDVKKLAELSRQIKPDEIQINTPLRPCSTRPLSRKEMEEIKKHFKFKAIKVISVYESKQKRVTPVSTGGTLRRRGKLKY